MRWTLVFFLLATRSWAQEPELKGVEACNRALKLAEEGRPAEAVALLQSCRDSMSEPDLWLWWGNLGLAHRRLRQDAAALEEFGKSLELKADNWFAYDRALLLHQFGRWEEALKVLDGPIPASAAERAQKLRAVIDGPFKSRYPRAWKKTEARSKLGNYLVVSDVGLGYTGLETLENQLKELDPSKKPHAELMEKLLRPEPELVNLANFLELARKEYMRLSAMADADWPKGKVFKVVFFRERNEFLQYANAVDTWEGKENTLGFYSPEYKFMTLYDHGSDVKICGFAKETLDTCLHEGWHQFFDVLTEQKPIWLNEGIAEFVGACDISRDGSRIVLGLLIRERGEFVTRYRTLKDSKKYYPLRELFRITPEQWHGADKMLLYAQSWSVVYYAMKGGNDSFKKDFQNFFKDLRDGKPWVETVEKHFPAKKLDALEKQWLDYIRKF